MRAYRHTFIFDKGILKESISEIQAYISAYHEQDEEYKKDGGNSLCDIYNYDTTLIIEGEETKVAPVFVVVIYSYDWNNFISTLLEFHDKFPKDKFTREYVYDYVTRDENQKIDDIPFNL